MSSMNFYQTQTYAGFWGGAVVMISLHSTFVSFFLFKARQSNISNFLKIIFNFFNFIRFTANVGLYLTPTVTTMLQCTALEYVISVGNFFVRVSLAAFLLWRLKQIHNNRTDTIVCLALLLIRAGFGVVPLGFQRPKVIDLPKYSISICLPNQATNKVYMIMAIIVDILIDFYVTGRLCQVLVKANKNAAQISSNMGNKNKRTLFTAVMYWNFLRLFVSLVFQATPLLNFLDNRPTETQTITLQSLVNIILSYVVTVDAEIVRVIEGRDGKKKGSSTGDSGKSFKSMSPQSPRSPRYYSGHSPSDLPKYSPQDDTTTIDKDKIVVSMKRLSFFEWANVVSGKRFRKNEDAVDDEEEIEEIIEDDIEKGPSYNRNSGSTTDVEKGPSDNRDSRSSITDIEKLPTVEESPAPNRDSTLSGSTSTTEETSTTLDGTPDIVINSS